MATENAQHHCGIFEAWTSTQTATDSYTYTGLGTRAGLTVSTPDVNTVRTQNTVKPLLAAGCISERILVSHQ